MEDSRGWLARLIHIAVTCALNLMYPYVCLHVEEEGAETLCKFPNCLRPRYQEPSGCIHDFCGRTHAQQYNSSKL